MKIHHSILEKSFKIFGENIIRNSKFRVLNVHDVLERDFDNLERILIDLKKKNWEFLEPSTFKTINKKNKKYILLTFDDGYKSQKIFADQILKKHNIKAIFFVITNFVKCTSKQDAKNFVLNNIDTNIEKNNERFHEVNNMDFEDLKELTVNDHLIGSHTVNHKKLTEIDNIDELNFEIVNSKQELENILECKINNFAWTYGDINSINKKIYNILKKHYNNIFSGIRGNNTSIGSGSIFFRDELSPFYTKELVNAFLNGYSDFYYYKNRRQLLNLETYV